MAREMLVSPSRGQSPSLRFLTIFHLKDFPTGPGTGSRLQVGYSHFWALNLVAFLEFWFLHWLMLISSGLLALADWVFCELLWTSGSTPVRAVGRSLLILIFIGEADSARRTRLRFELLVDSLSCWIASDHLHRRVGRRGGLSLSSASARRTAP